MKKVMSRFGEIEYDPQKIVHFPEGLIGFENLRDFVVIPGAGENVLFWIQSIEDPQVAFVLTDPTNFFLDYRVIPDERESAKLNVSTQEECLNLSVVTVHSDKTITLNLQAPILYAPGKNRGLQVILEKSTYATRTPLPSVPAANA
ncbi:MAG: flagellar assembly protein FliW [Geopsychrobacter sp.]|nr:flagellar assembly protein FliW [Geopsychrobacter sp.]